MLPTGRWRHRHTVLLFAVFAYFGIRFVEFVLSVVFKDIKAALDVSTFVIGVAVAASTVTYALAQLPSGVLGDRYGHRTVVLASIGLTAAASLVLAASPSGLGIVLGMAAVGLVSGAYYSPATALLADRFEEPGRAIGIHRVGAQAVGVTGPIVGVAGAMYGWRALLAASGLLALPVFVGFRTVVRPRPPADREASREGRIAPATVRDLLARPAIVATTLIAAFAQFADTATFSFLPLLLREYHGLTIEAAGGLFTAYFVAVAVGQPLAGWLSDRIGRDPVAAGALLVAIAGYLLLSTRPLPVLVGVGVVTVGLGMGWGPPVQARFMDHLGRDERGTGFGLVRSVYIGFAALSGLVVGGVATVWGWTAGIGVLLASLSIPVVFIVVLHGTARVR